MHKLNVKTLYEDTNDRLRLEIVNNKASFTRAISEGDLHRPGLALTGYVKVFTYQRVQVFGNTEMGFLRDLDKATRRKALETVLSFELPCIIVTESNEIPEEMLELANLHKITIFRTQLSTTQLMHLLSDYMDSRFAPSITVHGSLVDVFGMGVLFTGRSGIGKSEIALDLVERGHRLVADDVVNITCHAGEVLIGRGSELLQHHMEIRGLGIIDVRNIFGVNSVRVQKRIEVEVHLAEWDDAEEYERIGLDEDVSEYLDVKIPVVQLPIFPGKNITVIAEVIALNEMLKVYGHNTAQLFSDRLLRKIQQKKESAVKGGTIKRDSADRTNLTRLERYLERDYE
ncbi:MAG: HPr kinase/phosphorylase [Deferribacteres bacterium]|nr:HPr kinase/phosphorylase [candidate division KSB1 bacterium]MCB9508880.1 HPr kinase/phosphorylase [Deferribacteres bacterium]